MDLLDEILAILADGTWHPIDTIISIVNDSPLKIMLCLKFLEHYNFIDMDKKARSVAVSPKVLQFILGT